MPGGFSANAGTGIKIRGFVLDGKTGKAAPGTTVALSVEVDQGVERTVGVLTSDWVGYLSFDAGTYPSTPVAFLLRSPHFESVVSVRPTSIVSDRPCFVAFVNRADAQGCSTACCRGVGHLGTAIQNPDAADLDISPGSFGASGAGRAGSQCGGVNPPQYATTDLTLFRTVIDPAELPEQRWPTRPAELTERDDSVLVEGAVLPTARLVRLRQQWWYVGTTLGDIAYSLPLAPGETVQMATLEWDRSDRIVRADDVTSFERLTHDLHRDRTLTECIYATLRENQSGFSLAGGTATSSSAGASLNLEKLVGFPLDISAGASGLISAAGSVATSSGERTVDADATQTLNDTVGQTSELYRSLSSTVMVQADQAEGSTVQSRAVTNNNRCHALTMQYYEVLRTFRVDTWADGIGRGVLIPYRMLTFDADTALHHRSLIEPYLLQFAGTGAYDALARSTLTPEIYNDGPSQPSSGPAYAEGRSTHAVSAATPLETGLLVQAGSTLTIRASGTAKFGPDAGSGYTADGERYAADAGYPAPGLRRLSLVCRVGNAWHQGGTATTFTAVDEGSLVLQANDFDLANNIGSWSVSLLVARPRAGETAPSGPWQPAADQPFSRAQDAAAGKLLLRHLVDNAAYYSRLVWLRMHPAARRQALERYLTQHPRLLAEIGETPVAAFGSWLVFSATKNEDEPAATSRRVRLVSLPTRGLMVEAELGSCNACEKRDVTRRSDWPLTQPATIGTLQPGPRGDQPSIPTPTGLPAPVVAIQQAPAAPDPTGLAGALSLLGQANVFRDMSGLQQVGDLLDDLVNGTVSETNTALRAASARSALRNAITSQESGSGDRDESRSRRSSPSTTDPSRQVDRLDAIQYALGQGQIDSGQANDAAVGVLGGEVLAPGEGFFGPPTGPESGPAGPGSTAQVASRMVETFAASGGDSAAWTNLSRDDVATSLQELVDDPDTVAQRGLNLCGPAIFLRTWLRYDPAAVVRFAAQLYDSGRSSIGGWEVAPDDDACRATDYNALVTASPGRIPTAAGWMIMCAIRDSENGVFDYEGTPSEDISAITLPGEVAGWLRLTGLFGSIRNETAPFNPSLAHLTSLRPGALRPVILLIDASALPAVNLPWINAQFPNHYIGLESAVSTQGTDLLMSYWSWGKMESSIKIAKSKFAESYYGAILLER